MARLEEAFRCALSRQELLIARIDVAGDECGCVRIGPCDQQRGHVQDVGREARGDEVAHGGRGRDQHLAAHVATFFLRGQLVLEVHAGGAGLDHGLGQLEDIERTAKAGLAVGDDGGEPIPPTRTRPSLWSERASREAAPIAVPGSKSGSKLPSALSRTAHFRNSPANDEKAPTSTILPSLWIARLLIG